MIAGIHTDLGIKLFGDDLEMLKQKAAEIEQVVKSDPGCGRRDDRARSPGCRCSRSMWIGMPSRGTGSRSGRCSTPSRRSAGSSVGEIIEPDRRFPLAVRLPASYRDDPESLGKILIPTASGQRLPLTQLARFRETTGPATIHREWGRRRIVVEANVRGPRPRLVRQGGPAAGRRARCNCLRRLPRRVGRPVREPDPGRAAAAARRPAGAGPGPEPAVPDVPLASGRPDDLQRRALRPGRRRARTVVHGPAVHDLGGRRLRRPGRGVDAGGPGAGQCHPRPDGAAASRSARRSSRRGWHGCGRC